MPYRVKRLYLQAYRRWLEADAAWHATLREAGILVPAARERMAWTIGHGGSPVRRAYEARARAIEGLYRARGIYLATARAARRRRRVVLLQLPYPR
ncbi:hypothetical protein [Roseivivax sediminis]|uniref:Uncharacterized protein n=1 Tax=Roseivivax sediminis TaxID=936889 RepID=A0A1I2EFR5_9RHOB|nr:hypothetical protein [Roseivivax sediminis]SFE91090.1 hypothetical protein SAMN04515678_12227 [Roseivivax sediminis]